MTYRTRAAGLALLSALTLAGCSGASSSDPTTPTSGATSSSGATTGASTSAASPTGTGTSTPIDPGKTAAPLGPDLHCMNPTNCYLSNPKQRTDDQIEAYFKTVTGALKAPSPAAKPWAFVVLHVPDGQKLAASSIPKLGGDPVTDQFGILNHRALFAYCRVAEGGGPVTASTPRDKIWYQIEPFADGQPKQIWMSAAHLYPYQHDGALPAC